ncbi:MAG: diguanylate cyclase [Gammaproteobacteria bacterium]|nr:diguanylate cyclase [Gammaproteobacteria bacterium]
MQIILRKYKLILLPLLMVVSVIGIVMYPEQGLNMASLMKKADNAMYHIKSNGKRAVSFGETG